MRDKTTTVSQSTIAGALRYGAERVPGLAYMLKATEVISPVGRRILIDQPWLTDGQAIVHALEDVSKIVNLQSAPEHKKHLDDIALQLMQLRDIPTTLRQLNLGQQLDDIGLYEIKQLALIADKVRHSLLEVGIDVVEIPDLTPVIELLDPEGQRVAHFYVYDSYSDRLRVLRRILEKCLASAPDEATDEYQQVMQEEDRIRAELSHTLISYSGVLADALERLGALDVLIAKAKLAQKWHLVIPEVGEETQDSILEGLYNPPIAEALSARCREYQPVDITIPAGVTVITGANMAGKSVTLQSVALAQAMMQYGYPVPCRYACITPVQDICLSIGDGQDASEGLSSFAAEMMVISEILRLASEGKHLLVLIDEPARTTNPIEGSALMHALLHQLAQAVHTRSIVTTHYDATDVSGRKLRVRGLRPEASQVAVNVENINKYIDYSLQPDDGEDPPYEAMRIAELLGVNEGLLIAARKYMKEKV